MYKTLPKALQQLKITKAENDLLFTDDGSTLVDLFCGGGSAILGHNNQAVSPKFNEQANAFWNIGPLETGLSVQTEALVQSFFSPNYQFQGLYSTGMEVVEFALRVARAVNGKRGVVSFSNSMHGKSMATAHMGWDNGEAGIPGLYRLANIPGRSEANVLEELRSTLESQEVGAVIVEPILGSGGGHFGSAGYYQSLLSLCREFEALLIFDEILTGFHRTGSPFRHQALGIEPDLVLVGKAMSNGFPASAIMMRKDIEITPQMLPGSTYAGNPLACAAVCATLTEMAKLPMEASSQRISNTIESTLSVVSEYGVTLRGTGLLWFLEFETPDHATSATESLIRNGVFAGSAGKILRLMPPATISEGNLLTACERILEFCSHE